MSASAWAIEAWRRNEAFNPGGTLPSSPDPDCLLDADLIRSALLGRKLPPDLGSLPGDCPIVVEGAWISGRLNLSDARGPAGSAAPALVLRNCVIPEDILLREGHFARISFEGSRFQHIDARQARFDGTLDLTSVMSSQRPEQASGCHRDSGADTSNSPPEGELAAQPLCWVNLDGASIDGDLVVTGARLCAPPFDPEKDYSAGGRPHALRACSAAIAGHILLIRARAIGGVALADATVGNCIYASGAHLCSEWDTALQLQGARVNGSVVLNLAHPVVGDPVSFRADGMLGCRGLHVQGSVWIENATLNAKNPAEEYSLLAEDAHIENFYIFNTNAPHGIKAVGLRVNQRFDIQKSIIGSASDLSSLNITGAQIGGDCNIYDSNIDNIRAPLVKLSGSLIINAILGRKDWRYAAQFDHIVIDGMVQLNGSARGDIDFRSAKILGLFSIGQLRFAAGASPSMNFEGVQFGGGLSLGGQDKTGEALIIAAELQEGAPTHFRSLELGCYPGWSLVEAMASSSENSDYSVSKPGVVSMLWNGADRAISLFGTSPPLHEFNKERPPRLTPDTVIEYLRVFCHHVWADKGAFRILSGDELASAGLNPHEDDVRLTETPSHMGQPWHLAATVHYDEMLFRAKFAVQPSGMVEMLEDTPLEDDGKQKVWTTRFSYEPPYRRQTINLGASDTDSNLGLVEPTFSGNWKELFGADWAKAAQALENITAGPQTERLAINLTGAHATFLDDEGGRNWGKSVHLKMQGFTYDQLDRRGIQASNLSDEFKTSSTDSALEGHWQDRRDWLRLQEPTNGWDKPGDFVSEQYVQVARQYRSAGKMDDARNILEDQLWQECKLDAKYLFPKRKKEYLLIILAILLIIIFASFDPFWLITGILILLACRAPFIVQYLYGTFFRFGLGVPRTFLTFLGCLLIGWAGVGIANGLEVKTPKIEIPFTNLVLPSLDLIVPPALGVEVSLGRDILEDVSQQISTTNTERARLRLLGGSDATPVDCGKAIESLLYAADVFIPLLDLRQEIRCTPKEDAILWQRIKSLYAVLGWIVTSLTILSVTGLLRERFER